MSFICYSTSSVVAVNENKNNEYGLNPIICNSCGHSNNPNLENCYKCGTDLPLPRDNFTPITVKRPLGWFDFIFTTNIILNAVGWFLLIILLASGSDVISVSPAASVFLVFWVVIFTHASYRLGTYHKGARSYYLFVLAISSIFCALFDYASFFILFLFLIYAIGLNQDNVTYYDTIVKNKGFRKRTLDYA